MYVCARALAYVAVLVDCIAVLEARLSAALKGVALLAARDQMALLRAELLWAKEVAERRLGRLLQVWTGRAG